VLRGEDGIDSKGMYSKEISKQLRKVQAMKLYFKNFEIYRNISIYSQLPPTHTILSKLGHT